MIYVYYPFDDGTGLQTLDDLIRGIGLRNVPNSAPISPAIGELYTDAGSTPGGFWNVTNMDEIYIVGHSYSGMKVLGDADRGTIDQTEIVKRLLRCGLSKTVTCKINVYACFSARAADQTVGLAGFVASALKTNGFACYSNVWGYTLKVCTKALKVDQGDYALHAQPLNTDTWVALRFLEYAYMNVPPHV